MYNDIPVQKIINNKLKKNNATTMKLKAKSNVPVHNLQLVGCSLEPQGRQRGIDTVDEGKVSINSLQFIRRLCM
jgi:hypothetical protein